MCGVASGVLEVVQLLVESGADPNVIRDGGHSPLGFAVNHPRIFNYLMPLTNTEIQALVQEQSE